MFISKKKKKLPARTPDTGHSSQVARLSSVAATAARSEREFIEFNTF